MGHLSFQSPKLKRLQERLDQNIMAMPASETLFRILSILYSEEEAEIGAKMPLMMTPIDDIARRLGKSVSEIEPILQRMVWKGLVFDLERDGKFLYMLAPPVIGFFEMSFMRVREDIDQTKLAELFDLYFNESDAFLHEFSKGQTHLGRTLVREEVLSEGDYAEILDHEKASYLIESAKVRAVGICYCRHKAHHLNKACGVPLEMCMTLNVPATILIRNGFAKPIETVQALEILAQGKENGLVQIGDNIQRNVSYICNCCGCCCGQLHAVQRLKHFEPVHTSNFIAMIDRNLCKGCMRCAKRCPINAIDVKYAYDGANKERYSEVDESVCLGCGVCVGACKESALRMEMRSSRVVTPENTFDRVVRMALERDKLASLLFDDPDRMSHRALRLVLNTLLNLPPANRLKVKEQLKSNFIHLMMETVKKTPLAWIMKL